MDGTLNRHGSDATRPCQASDADPWAGDGGSEERAEAVRVREQADREREKWLTEKARHLEHGNAEVARAELAKRLGVDVRLVKPCVARIGVDQVPEGERDLYATVLGAELVKMDVAEDTALGFLGWYASRCEQPPFAKTRYSIRAAQGQYRYWRRKQQAGQKIRGYGCGVEPGSSRALVPFCICADNIHACPYVRGGTRPAKREGMTTLLGAWNLMQAHRAPARWNDRQVVRRSLLFMLVGVLENLKGQGGVQLITSERELEANFPGHTTRKTIRADLRAMAAAGWISYEPGQSRRDAPGLPARGSTIRRLLPEDSARSAEPPAEDPVAMALAVFPGAEVLPERVRR